jgi:type II secretory pathway pseudopilin PulG
MGEAAEHCTNDEGGPPQEVRDRGTSLVEILMSIVLLGVAIGAMLTTLRVTVNASGLERDHANAHAWLQTAADVLYGAERQDCGSMGPDEIVGTADDISSHTTVVDTYQAIVKGSENPEQWPTDKIAVVSVEYWDGDVYQGLCYDDKGINLQLITIQVKNLDDRIIETVQVVKGG